MQLGRPSQSILVAVVKPCRVHSKGGTMPYCYTLPGSFKRVVVVDVTALEGSAARVVDARGKEVFVQRPGSQKYMRFDDA